MRSTPRKRRSPSRAHGGEAKFWGMHDLLYENQAGPRGSDLLAYAESLGVDDGCGGRRPGAGAHGDACPQGLSQRRPERRQRHADFFVNGRRYDGDWSDPDAFLADLRSLARPTTRR